MALLVLAWLERHLALLLFALGYLAVLLVSIDFGWRLAPPWDLLPHLVILGSVLLLGAIGVAVTHRRYR